MRYNNSRHGKVSLVNFIIDKISELVPESTPTTNVQAVTDEIVDEVVA